MPKVSEMKYQLKENSLREYLKRLKAPYCFLETALADKENKDSYLFNDFVDILTFKPGGSIDKFFKKIQSYTEKGYWLCGFFNYEFGYCLEPVLENMLEGKDSPLAWFGVCKKPIKLDCRGRAAVPGELEKNTYKIKNIKPNISEKEYSERIKQIKHYLEEGLTYQVNFTFKVKFEFSGCAPELYLGLRRSQPTAYSAFIDTGKDRILSFSPELFFRTNGDKIITRPMKGTIKRGLTAKGDNLNKQTLRKDEKTKAENLMIVDLLRNDLGRVAKKVWVPKLFEVERHKTLFQMTSTIAAQTKNNLKQKELFSSIFPCGSVTGAPKIKTMEIIKELEKEPRNIYTGAIGYISPESSCFNVAIRTIQLNKTKGELGIGGGIVYDSEYKSEYDEALLKAKFFMGGYSDINLVESIFWDKNYRLLDLHLRRLVDSCKYFSIFLDLGKLKSKLDKIVKTETRKLKIRVLVDVFGNISVDKEPLEQIQLPVKITLSPKIINSQNAFLYHKTTQRYLYDSERKRLSKKGFFDVVFRNEKGQITEGAISNVFILKNRKLYTSPVSCGLLPGVLRKHLLESNKAKEKPLFLEDILGADKLYIGNSVRGLMEAEFRRLD